MELNYSNSDPLNRIVDSMKLTTALRISWLMSLSKTGLP